jgi:thiosulfate reductase cytochrome b subunit
VYAVWSLLSGHLYRNLLPGGTGFTWWSLRHNAADAHSYNPLQRLTYLFVIFGLFPLVIWTGLAMSPAFDAAVPAAVNLLGGRQSARTLHFFVSAALVLFLLVHVAMVWLAGFRSRVGAMITGRAAQREAQ